MPRAVHHLAMGAAVVAGAFVGPEAPAPPALAPPRGLHVVAVLVPLPVDRALPPLRPGAAHGAQGALLTLAHPAATPHARFPNGAALVPLPEEFSLPPFDHRSRLSLSSLPSLTRSRSSIASSLPSVDHRSHSPSPNLFRPSFPRPLPTAPARARLCGRGLRRERRRGPRDRRERLRGRLRNPASRRAPEESCRRRSRRRLRSQRGRRRLGILRVRKCDNDRLCAHRRPGTHRPRASAINDRLWEGFCNYHTHLATERETGGFCKRRARAALVRSTIGPARPGKVMMYTPVQGKCDQRSALGGVLHVPHPPRPRERR